jgi:hypothetical protein
MLLDKAHVAKCTAMQGVPYRSQGGSQTPPPVGLLTPSNIGWLADQECLIVYASERVLPSYSREEKAIMPLLKTVPEGAKRGGCTGLTGLHIKGHVRDRLSF